MTVISALRCPEGAVLTSDSREIRGAAGDRLASDVAKIYEPRSGFLVAWAGFADVAQAFALRMQRARDLTPARDRLDLQQRFDALMNQVREQGKTDYAEWLIAWWCEPEDKAVTLHLRAGGRSDWVSDRRCAGDQEPTRIAHVVGQALRFMPPERLTLEQAKLVALKTMRDTLAVGVESIGGEAQLGSVSRSAVEVLTSADLEPLHDTIDVWEERAAELLLGSATVPADSTTPDRGVRPPPA